VQLLAGNSVTGPAVLSCLHTADTRALRELHPAVAGVVAGVPWVDMDTPVVDVVRWRAALPAAMGARVDRLPERPGDLVAAAAALTCITRLHLHDCGISVTVDVLGKLPLSLRMLKVVQPRVLWSGIDFARLTALVSLECDELGARVERLPPSLRDLHLGYSSVPPTANFGHLASLRVLSCSLGEFSSAAIASLPPSLEVLDVGRTRVPIGVLLAHLPRLRVLRGGYNNNINADTVATLPPCLVELALPWCMLSLSFAHLHALQALDVSDSGCANASLASLPPSLVTLEASRCKRLTPAAMLPHLPALTTLNINGTAVGDALVASLPAGLTTLGIVDCPRVTHSATLDHLPALRELRCSGTDLSPATLAACRVRGCTAAAEGVLCGHTRSVKYLAVQPDGRLASGDTGGTVRLWDVARRSETSVLLNNDRSDAAVLAVLPDGARLARGCVVDFGLYGSVTRGLTIHTLGSDGGATPVEVLCDTDVWSLLVLPDGRLAAGCGDGNIRVVDVDAAAVVAVLAGHTARVAALAVLSDGRLASGSLDTRVRVWDVGARTCVAMLAGQGGEVTSLTALPDGRLASGDGDGRVRLWDVGAATCVDVLAGHTDRVTALAVLPDGRLASGSSDGAIRVWTLRRDANSQLPASFALGMLLALQLGSVATLVALPDGRLASSDGKSIRLWHPPPHCVT